MSKSTFRKAAAITLVICMLFAVCSVAFAQSRMIVSTRSSFIRDSNTKGTATLIANSSNTTDPYITSTMILQEAPLGSTSFTNSNIDPKVKTTTDATIGHVVTFPITTTKEYRVKMEIRDIVNGNTYLTIHYEYLQ
ncbi:MAG: hypothetical protein IJ994_00605 [Firmicutes bacterium]|nr:hypothetical protein [Bacillota bacterium]